MHYYFWTGKYPHLLVRKICGENRSGDECYNGELTLLFNDVSLCSTGESTIHIVNTTSVSYAIFHLSICPSIYLSICLSIYLSIYPSLHLSIHPSIYLSIQSSIRLFNHSFIYHLSIHSFICPSIYLFIHLHIHPCRFQLHSIWFQSPKPKHRTQYSVSQSHVVLYLH